MRARPILELRRGRRERLVPKTFVGRVTFQAPRAWRVGNSSSLFPTAGRPIRSTGPPRGPSGAVLIEVALESTRRPPNILREVEKALRRPLSPREAGPMSRTGWPPPGWSMGRSLLLDAPWQFEFGRIFSDG